MYQQSHFDSDVPEVVAKSLFSKYDVDKSGFLEVNEIKALFTEDFGLNKEQANVYARLLDTDGDSKVSFEELLKWLQSGENLQLIDDRSRYSKVCYAVELFEKYDVNKNHSLDEMELKRLLKECGSLYSKETELKDLDTDGNGRVSFLEFLKWLNWVPMNMFK